MDASDNIIKETFVIVFYSSISLRTFKYTQAAIISKERMKIKHGYLKQLLRNEH